MKNNKILWKLIKFAKIGSRHVTFWATSNMRAFMKNMSSEENNVQNFDEFLAKRTINGARRSGVGYNDRV